MNNEPKLLQPDNNVSYYVDISSLSDCIGIDDICKEKLNIEVGGMVFSILCQNREDTHRFIREWRTVDLERQSEYRIYLLYITKNQLFQAINENLDNDTKEFILFETNDDIFYGMSKDRKCGWIVNTSSKKDQWGAPLYERVRWQIATHIYYACEKKGKIAFHASAVTKDQNVVILFGNAGQGKSTQTARLINAGWSFLSDDRVLISCDQDKLCMEAFWNSIKIRQDVSDHKELEWVKMIPVITESSYEDIKYGNSIRSELQCEIEKIYPQKIVVVLLNMPSKETVEVSSGKAMMDIMEAYILLGTLWDAASTRKEIFNIAHRLVKDSICVCIDKERKDFCEEVNRLISGK